MEKGMRQIYQGTKFVCAEPMTLQAYNDVRGWTLPENEQGRGGDAGYLVEYMDGGKPNTPDYAGYVSWSPEAIFDNAYVALPDCHRDTPDWLLRLHGERVTLDNRIAKLRTFTESDSFAGMIGDMRDVMICQLSLMEQFSALLARRIKLIKKNR